MISHGEGCARPETPGVYTRVHAYMDWIKDTMVEASKRNADLSKRPRTVCPTHICDNRCRPSNELCDWKIDCKDKSDEMNCEYNHNGVLQFRAPDEQGQDRVGARSPFVPHHPHNTNMVAHALPITSQVRSLFFC